MASEIVGGGQIILSSFEVERRISEYLQKYGKPGYDILAFDTD